MSKLISNDNIYMPHLGEDDSKLKYKEIIHDSIKGETRKEKAKRYNLMDAEEKKLKEEEEEAMKEQKEMEAKEAREEEEEKKKQFNDLKARIEAKKAAGTFKKRMPKN